MLFNIKKNATLPLLKLQVVKDGRSDYNKFMDLLEVSSLFFSMVDIETGIPKITSRPAGFVEKTFIDPNAEPEYYIYYQFTNRDTNKVGRFEGQFMLRSSDGNLILPIREKLYIDIQESFIADDLDYQSCYVSEFPCCVNPPSTTTTTTCPPVPLILELEAIISSGSTIIDYNLYSNKNMDEDISMTFEHILNVYTGSPINIVTGITISTGFTSGSTQIILDTEYNNLTRIDSFINVVVPSGAIYTTREEFTIPPTPTPTPSPTPTPTPEQVIIDAILTEEQNVYIEPGNNEYLSYQDPTIEFLVGVSITSGSVVSTFTTSINYSINDYITIPITATLNLIGGGSYDIETNVIIPPYQYSGITIVNNPSLSYFNLDKTGEISVGIISPFNVSYDIQASQISFQQEPTPTPTPTNTSTPTPTPSVTPTNTPTPTPTQSPIPQVELTLYIQSISGGESIIFNGETYTGDTTITINKNQSYNIEAVPQPGYLFAGWNIFGGSFSSTAQTTTVSVSLDSGANLAPSYVVNPNYDALEDQLSTNLADYQNAIDNDWVRITQSEYNNIFNNVDGVIKIGNTDEQVNIRASETGFNTTTFGTTDADTPLTIPTGYYVVGFIAESWNQNGGVQLGYTTTYHTGSPTYMGNSPNVIGGMTMFYVRKRPAYVEGAPASTNLYPVLNFLSPAYPNAVPNTYGWQTGNGGVTWFQTDPAGQTAKIQILLTNILSWPVIPPTPTPTQTPTPTITPSETPTPTVTPTPTKTPNCVIQIVVPTLWNGATTINSNQLKLTQTSETLQIQVGYTITDFNGATSIVGYVSSDGTYTYVGTGPGGGVAFNCQFPLTFSGSC